MRKILKPNGKFQIENLVGGSGFVDWGDIGGIISDQTDLYALLPTVAQKQAMDNANAPDAFNPFATIADLSGGLPTGQINSDYVFYDTPGTYNSGTFTDVTGSDLSVTVSGSAAFIYAGASLNLSQSGGGQNITDAQVRIVIGSENGDGISFDFSSNDVQVGSTIFRTTTPLAIGTYTVKLQAKRVTDPARDFIINKLKVFSFVLQAAKGDAGVGVPAGGATDQVLSKIDGTDYNTQWVTPTDGTVTSVSGTANRITSSGGATPVIDIDAAYDALWQPVNANLTTIAGLTATTDNFIVSVSSAWASRTPTEVRTTLGLVIGIDVQAYSANLTTYAGLTPTTVGGNFITLPNPSAITFPRINVDNTVDALNAADFRTAIGAGTGSGTVTNVSSANGDATVANQTTTPEITIVSAPKLTTAKTLWGQSFDGSGNVTGSLTDVINITGGANNMVVTAGTGNSRTMTLRTTTSGGAATTALTLAIDQSATFANTVNATTFLGSFKSDTTISSASIYAVPLAEDTTDSSFALKGVSQTMSKILSGGIITTITTENSNYASLIIGSHPVASPLIGTNPLYAQLAIKPLTNGVSDGAVVTNTATLYIENADVITTTGGNYALWVDAGDTRLDGNVIIGGAVTSGTWTAGVIAGQYGGTGVANTGKTITVSGNTTIGSSTHTVAFTTSANTSVALPASGAVLASITAPATNPFSGTPSASTFLRGDGTWASASASPGGSNTEVQFNDSGSFGGDAGMVYNKTTDILTVAGEVITPILRGGTASGGNLTLSSTSDATTKGKVIFGSSAYDEVNDRLGVNVGSDAPVARVEVRTDDLKLIANTDRGSGLNLRNTTNTDGVNVSQDSPPLVWTGKGRNTAGAQRVVEFRTYLTPTVAVANPTAILKFDWAVNSLTFATRFGIGSAGQLYLGSGVDVGTSGQVLKSGGTTGAASWLTLNAIATTGLTNGSGTTASSTTLNWTGALSIDAEIDAASSKRIKFINAVFAGGEGHGIAYDNFDSILGDRPVATWHVHGSFALHYILITDDDSLYAVGVHDSVISCDTSVSLVDVKLPKADEFPERIITIKLYNSASTNIARITSDSGDVQSPEDFTMVSQYNIDIANAASGFCTVSWISNGVDWEVYSCG
jgi:hypothetical protein